MSGFLQKTSPDVSFCTTDIAINGSWSVSSESLGSDHLIVKISFKYPDLNNITLRRNLKKADWANYRQIISKYFVDVPPPSDNVQCMYDYFNTLVNKAADKTIPFIKLCNNPVRKFTPKVYWNQQLSKVVAERRLALTNFRKNPIPQNLNLLNIKISESQKIIRQARSKSFHNFCDSIDETTTSSIMWRKMRWMKGFRQTRSYSSDVKKEELLNSLAPDFVMTPKPIFDNNESPLICDFLKQELESCFKAKDTSPGLDNITYSMIFNLPIAAKKYLLDIYNLIFKTSSVPFQWRDIYIVPIPKTSSGSDSKLRPIALISCLCKIFHSMILKRLEWFMEYNKILAPSTTGFRRNHSCHDSLARLVTKIQIGFTKNIPTVAAFLDVEGAYNNVLIDRVVHILNNLKVGKYICSYIWNFLKERHLTIKADESDRLYIRWTGKGIAQGDPLSPLLFNMITANICQNINNVCFSQYADDFVLYCNNSRIDDSVNNMQQALDLFVTAIDELGLELSSNKSKLCIFTRGRRRLSVDIKVNNRSLEAVDCIKYLGMWLDKCLRWGKHINEVYESSQKKIQLLKVLVGSSWGIHPSHMRRLYMALIRSRIDYGCFLYDNSAISHTYKLEKLQNLALRIIGGFIKSTPIHVMESELSIPPLQIRRQYLSLKFCLKLQSRSNDVCTSLITDLSSMMEHSYWNRKRKPLLVTSHSMTRADEISSSYPGLMFTLKTWVSSIDIKDIIKCNLVSVTAPKSHYDINSLKYNALNELRERYTGWNVIYTDGSKTSDGVGAAFCDLQNKCHGTYSLNKHISIMTAELFAISEALKYVQQLNANKVVICTDSKSALQHISKCVHNGCKGLTVAYKILDQIKDFNQSGKKIIFQWIPSHVGLAGNIIIIIIYLFQTMGVHFR